MTVLARAALVLLAAALAVIAAYVLKPPPSDPARDEAALVAQAVKGAPQPGGQDALMRTISGLQQGRPDYSRVNPALARVIRLDLARQQPELAALGPLQSADYLGARAKLDLYRAHFANGSLLWGIAIGQNGFIQNLAFFSSRPWTAQDWIDNYARFTWSERSVRLAEQVGILLAAALFGRLAFRLRL